MTQETWTDSSGKESEETCFDWEVWRYWLYSIARRQVEYVCHGISFLGGMCYILKSF